MTRLRAFEVYEMYLALNAHFTRDEYDYFFYCGKVRIKEENFRGNKYYFTYQRLARIPDTFNFILANFIYGEVKYVKQLLDPKAKEHYLEYIRDKESLMYRFKEDLNKINLLTDFKGNDPVILNKFWNNEISPLTMTILEDIIHFTEKMESKNISSLLLPPIKRKLNKISPFLTYDKPVYADYLRNVIDAG